MMDLILEHWEVALAAAIALATAITRITPTPKDDRALSMIRDALGRLSILEHRETGRRFKMPLARTKGQPHPDDMPPEQSPR